MSQEIERYLQAGTRASTRRSYQQALEHFEVTWGGFLPATSDAIVRYLVDHAAMLSSNTQAAPGGTGAVARQPRLPRSDQDPTGSPDPQGNPYSAPAPGEAGRAVAIAPTRTVRAVVGTGRGESTSGGRLAAVAALLPRPCVDADWLLAGVPQR